MSKRYTISVDFDGVLHSYTSGWLGVAKIADPPVEGAIEWLHSMIQHFDVHILSTRGRSWRGRFAMRAWLKRHSGSLWWPAPGFRGIEDVCFLKHKGAALVYLDDRAMRFDGPYSWPTRNDIHQLRPWNKPSCGAREQKEETT